MSSDKPPPFEATQSTHRTPCEHAGCEAEIVMVCAHFTADEPGLWPDEHYCCEHALIYGYCGRCGDHAETNDHFASTGRCDHCQDIHEGVV